MKTETVVCERCNTLFERASIEVRRSQKKGRRQYCSRTCQGKILIENIPVEKRHHPENLIESNWRKDEFSPFRHFMKVIRLRQREKMGLEADITLEDLKALWERQGGRCALSGVVLELDETTTTRNKSSHSPWLASLDRIDQTRGYMADNVRWVSQMANLARNRWSDAQVIEFGRAVARYNP